jgi:hypothetical protein
MPQIFHPSFNTISRVSIFGAVFVVTGAFAIAYTVVRSPYVTEVGVVREQPVPFSHRHHVGQVGLDCRYCHTSVEESASAGLPPTQTCMNCHAQLFKDSDLLAPVRESFRTGEPLVWTRVHDLPDFAYFNHSIHLQKGIGCSTCHGQVDNMPLMWRESTLQMQWCLDCHRNPEKHIRPREEIFNMNWKPSDDPHFDARKLIVDYHVKSKTDCSSCHH